MIRSSPSIVRAICSSRARERLTALWRALSSAASRRAPRWKATPNQSSARPSAVPAARARRGIGEKLGAAGIGGAGAHEKVAPPTLSPPRGYQALKFAEKLRAAAPSRRGRPRFVLLRRAGL